MKMVVALLEQNHARHPYLLSGESEKVNNNNWHGASLASTGMLLLHFRTIKFTVLIFSELLLTNYYHL